MKFSLVLLLFVALPAAFASFAPSIEGSLNQMEDECMAESGLSLAEVENIRRNQAVPDNEKANQWAKCMMIKHNVINSGGTINTVVQTIQIPADTDTVIRAFPLCQTLVGRDLADTGRLMMNCYFKNSGGLLMGFSPRQK